MNKSLSLLCLINFSLIYSSGFDLNTIVTLASGETKPISEIKIGDEVISYDRNIKQGSGVVQGTCTFIVDSSIEITTETGVIIHTCGIERLFLPKEETWVCAKDLKVGDCFLSNGLELAEIVKIEHYNQPRQMCALNCR